MNKLLIEINYLVTDQGTMVVLSGPDGYSGPVAKFSNDMWSREKIRFIITTAIESYVNELIIQAGGETVKVNGN